MLASLVSSSAWTYPVAAGMVMLDGFVPLVPGETVRDDRRGGCIQGRPRGVARVPRGVRRTLAGDNLSYLVGVKVGRGATRKLFTGESSTQRLGWARRAMGKERGRRGGAQTSSCIPMARSPCACLRRCLHARGHEHRRAGALGRSPAMAFGIGLVHGIGGSAGVCVVLLSAVAGRATAAVALGVLASATALSMTLLSVAFGGLLSRAATARGLDTIAHALGALSLAFGVVYAVGAAASFTA